jgi:hypothetical protein
LIFLLGEVFYRPLASAAEKIMVLCCIAFDLSPLYRTVRVLSTVNRSFSCLFALFLLDFNSIFTTTAPADGKTPSHLSADAKAPGHRPGALSLHRIGGA